ncbi:MAG: phosphoribosylaminoimidazolesuccinocarboxamide synthase [Alistipes sp.]|nr:phosphoribosylaminoimidazolesuccinocarboxamide synthase [Alistipes sp.]
MAEQEVLYNGSSKTVFRGEGDNITIRFKDYIAAFYGIKGARIENKARMNCSISSLVLGYLNDNGIRTHFVAQTSDTEQQCRHVTHIPIEVIVRNVVAGSMAKRLGLEEGIVPENTIFDLCLRDNELGDPLINDHHAVALGLVSYEELAEMYDVTSKVNSLLKELYAKVGVTLVDFKIEFGRAADGSLVLADELTPDTCRLWDVATGERLDKDRFRRDLGRVRETYEDVAERLANLLNK